MLRSIGAVAGGFLTMAVLVGASTAAAMAALIPPALPGEPRRPTVTYLAVNLACSLAAAVAGGFVCAWIAPSRPAWHGVALAGLLLALSIVSAVGTPAGSGQPPWYPYVIAIVGCVGVLSGAAIRSWTST